MRVVRKTILDKILVLLPDPDIVRIELTSSEFRELVKGINERVYKVDREFITGCPDYSGSYFVIKGTCIQTDSSYE